MSHWLSVFLVGSLYLLLASIATSFVCLFAAFFSYNGSLTKKKVLWLLIVVLLSYVFVIWALHNALLPT
jgi:hypothetical protein